MFIVQKSFCVRNAIKNETKNVNKNSLFYLIFVIFLIFWPLELKMYHGDPVFWNLIFTYFPTMNNFKEISLTSFYCIIPPQVNYSWVFLFLFYFVCWGFFWRWWLLIAFSWISRFTRDSSANSLALYKYLPFSCVVSLRTSFLEISLPDNLPNALSVVEVNRVGFNDGSAVEWRNLFCWLFFQIARNMNILVISVVSQFCERVLYQFFLRLQKNCHC